MPQRTKTVEYVFETGTALRSTVTALAGTNFYTPAAVTMHLPETDATRTIRSVQMVITARDAETTTARRVDGARIGVQIDAVAWSDADLTGTGIANTGDPYTVHFSRDVTSYFTTNFTAASHSVGARVEFETDVASNVNSITIKLLITYEYQDTSATHVKTVRIPMEGLTSFVGTSANGNIRGSAASGQIPALDTFLPEASKVYRQIWFEITAADGGAAATDFTLSCSVSGATTSARGTVEQALTGSSVYYDIWIPGGGTGVGYFATNAVQDFQAWSSLANTFQRLSVVLCVTYTYPRVTSGTVINSIVIPIGMQLLERAQGTVTGDKDRFTCTLWVEEPGTITLVQSAAFLTFFSSGASNADVRVNSQGSTSSLYTINALIHAGHHSIQHRLDLAHGGSAVTLARGENTLTLDMFSSTNNASGVSAVSGVYIINYTSTVHASGEGVHNHSVAWSILTTHAGAIGGDNFRTVTTATTPILPEATAFFNDIWVEVRGNYSGFSTGVYMGVLAAVNSGELGGDGWVPFQIVPPTDGEYGYAQHFLKPCPTAAWDRWVNDSQPRLDPEVARNWRWNSANFVQWSGWLWLTYHAITFAITGNVTNSAGGTVNITAHRADTGEQVGSTSRTGNGSYTITVYDNTKTHFAAARESAALLGRSDDATPT